MAQSHEWKCSCLMPTSLQLPRFGETFITFITEDPRRFPEFAHPRWSTLFFLTSLRNTFHWNKSETNNFNGKWMTESESTNVWKPNKQLTGFLRLWHVIEREKKKSYSILCQESFSVFAKNWAHSSGLSLCRLAAASQTEVHTQMPANMASTSCLSLNTKLGFCPPKHNNKTQNGVLHIGHFRSALKHCKGLPFRFFVSLLHRDEESTAVLSGVMESQSCAKH